MTTSSNVELWISFDHDPKLALSIPLTECQKFAVHPLKWLQFLGYAIYGRKGSLHTLMTDPSIDNYTADIEARPYFFISKGKPHLVDIDVANDRTTSISGLNDRSSDFRDRLISRDGTCVVTGYLACHCEAAHIIPHSKGDDYMESILRHRCGSDVDDLSNIDDLSDIDDIRNGLLLNSLIHTQLTRGACAFLKTPNFALSVDDIPYHLPKLGNEDRPTSRLTLQHFLSDDKIGPLLSLTPQNIDARQPEDMTQWPPAVIVDILYACVALKAWSPESFIRYVRKNSKSTYYGNVEDDNAGDGSADAGGGGSGYIKAPRVSQKSTRRYNHDTRSGGAKRMSAQVQEKEFFSELFDGVGAIWMRSSKEDKQKQLAARRSRKEDGIKTWLKSTELSR